MRKLLVTAILLFLFVNPVYSAVTTTDGAITLDLYEDTQSGINNRWILDFTINDVVSVVNEIEVVLNIGSVIMDYGNYFQPVNTHLTDDFNFGFIIIPPAPGRPALTQPIIESKDFLSVGSQFTFYSLPYLNITGEQEGILLNDYFQIGVQYTDNLGNQNSESLTIYGPIGFAPVPEPLSIFLFVFGALFLKYIKKGS